MRPLVRLLLLGGSRAAAAALGSLSAMLLARSLGPEALGVWSLALAVQGYALHLGEFGLRSVATATVARVSGRRLLLRRYLALRLTLSAAILTLVGGGAILFAPAAAPVLMLAVASILAAALQLDWVALADDRNGLAAALLFARPLAFLLLLRADHGTVTLSWAALAFSLSWLIAAVLSWAALGGARAALPRAGAAPPRSGALLRAGAPLCAVTLLNQALLSGDLLLAGACLGPVIAGHYYVATQIATAGLVIANAAGQAALARLACLAPDEAAFAAALRVEARAVVGCGLLLTLAQLLAAPVLLPLLFGPAQAAAIPVLLALLPWFLLQHLTTLLQAALVASGAGRRVLHANLVMLAAMVPALLVAALAHSLPLFALAVASASWRGSWRCYWPCRRRAGPRCAPALGGAVLSHPRRACFRARARDDLEQGNGGVAMTAVDGLIAARHGAAARVRLGQRVRVTNTHGTQVVDTWAFNADDLGEPMSMEHSRAAMLRLVPRVGDVLVTSRRRPILTLLDDTAGGIHDTLIAACDRYRYEQLGCVGHHRNCTDNLHEALAALGLAAPGTPSPLNLFMNIPWHGEEGRLSFDPPVSTPGSHVTFRAEMDLVIAFSACPQDVLPINGLDREIRDARFAVLD